MSPDHSRPSLLLERGSPEKFEATRACPRPNLGAMEPIATTPDPPYTAVIFTAVPGEDMIGYGATAADMLRLAAAQPGYLGVESAQGDGTEITVSYWTTHDAARAWKQVAEHLGAQRLGRERWYGSYRVRIATVDREYGYG